MSVAVIIVERPLDESLPRGPLEELGGASALRRCIDRCGHIASAEALVFAPGPSALSNEAGDIAEKAGVTVLRGQGGDALARAMAAARSVSAEWLILAPWDQPFFDPSLADKLFRHVRVTAAEYGCMDMPVSWPQGLECEVLSARRLRQAEIAARTADDRLFVTPWIRRNPAIRRANLTGPGGEFAKLNWSLRRDVDLQFARAIFKEMGPRAARASALDLVNLLLRSEGLRSLSPRPHGERGLDEPIIVDAPSEPFRFDRAAA